MGQVKITLTNGARASKNPMATALSEIIERDSYIEPVLTNDEPGFAGKGHLVRVPHWTYKGLRA
jgi:hypothetical protein